MATRAQPSETAKSKSKSGATTKDTAAKLATDGAKRGRNPGGPRGWLELAVFEVLSGPNGKGMKVTDIVEQITAPATGVAPSSGAVNAVLYRWRDAGFAKFDAKPLRFAGFTGPLRGDLEKYRASIKRPSKNNNVKADSKVKAGRAQPKTVEPV